MTWLVRRQLSKSPVQYYLLTYLLIDNIRYGRSIDSSERFVYVHKNSHTRTTIGSPPAVSALQRAHTAYRTFYETRQCNNWLTVRDRGDVTYGSALARPAASNVATQWASKRAAIITW